MFLERLTDADYGELVKAIIKEETNAKHIVKNDFEMPLEEIGRAVGINEHEYIFAYSPITVRGECVKEIEIKGYTIYKDLFSQAYCSEFGRKTYYLTDFILNTTNSNLSYKFVEKEDIEKVFHKFMYQKFGKEYLDEYKKFRTDELNIINNKYKIETKKNIDEMTK